MSLSILATFAQNEVINVATFKGAQVTGITVTNQGRVFANFPRWRMGVPFSVVEVFQDGSYKPYPSDSWNTWEAGQEATSDKFMAVQSVVAHKDRLYVLETANPLFKGLVSQPKIYVFDLASNKLVDTYTFAKNVVKKNSYTNDLRIDDKKGKIYITDSGEAGLIIMDIKTRKFTRVLDNHLYTKAETDHLMFNGQKWQNTVHSDGIALDTKNDILYIHALTGYTLYGFNTRDLLNPARLKKAKPFKMRTAAPDGMIMDAKGNLYFGDLENDKIEYLTRDRKQIKTLVEGEKVRWADTFSIYDGYLYYSNARINEAGDDVSKLTFTINKVKLAQ